MRIKLKASRFGEGSSVGLQQHQMVIRRPCADQKRHFAPLRLPYPFCI